MRGGGKKNLESFYPTTSGNQTQTVKVIQHRLSRTFFFISLSIPFTLALHSFPPIDVAHSAVCSGRVRVPQTHERLPCPHREIEEERLHFPHSRSCLQPHAQEGQAVDKRMRCCVAALPKLCGYVERA